MTAFISTPDLAPVPDKFVGMSAWIRGDVGAAAALWQEQFARKDFVQATGANQPAFTAGAHGFAYATFAGATQVMTTTNTLLGGGACTKFLKFKINTLPVIGVAASSFQTLSSWPQNATRNFAETLVTGAAASGFTPYTWHALETAGVTAGVGIADALDLGVHRLIWSYNGQGASTPGNYTALLDGVSKAVVASGNLSRTITDLGSVGARSDLTGAAALPFIGRIYEDFGFSRQCSAELIRQIDAQWLSVGD